MSKNIRAQLETFQKKYPNKVRYISGKWFEGDDEINNIDKYFYDLAKDPKYKIDFSFFENVTDIHNFEDLFIIAYGDERGIWPKTKYAKLSEEYYNEHKDINKSDAVFPLTFEQLLIIGVMLFRPQEEVFFILTGVGGSGKSTFGNIVKQLFNNDVSHTSLDDLSGFKLAEAVKKRLIYSEEISNKEINCSNLKMLASKQEIMVEPKYITPINVKTQSSLMFICNKIPPIDIDDSGIMRRLIFYSRDKKIENPNLSLRDNVYSEEELIKMGALAYKAILATPNWRDIFKYDTYHCCIDNNTVYKMLQKHLEQKKHKADFDYSTYWEMCSDSHILERYRKNESNFYKILEYINENENEGLPF